MTQFDGSEFGFGLNADEVGRLIAAAREASGRAYAPYSRFRVGCAVACADGSIVPGCNVENAAYSPTCCAERTALFAAIAFGHAPLSFRAMAVAGDTLEPITPCGVCRQVMAELCRPDMPVVLVAADGRFRLTTVEELLPAAFRLDRCT